MNNTGSLNAVLGDLEAIWTTVVTNDLEVEKSDFKVKKKPDEVCDRHTNVIKHDAYRIIMLC